MQQRRLAASQPSGLATITTSSQELHRAAALLLRVPPGAQNDAERLRSFHQGLSTSLCDVPGHDRWVRNPRERGMAAALTCLARVPVRAAGQRVPRDPAPAIVTTSTWRSSTESVLFACRASAHGMRGGMACREGGKTRFCGAYGWPSVLMSAVSMEDHGCCVHAPVMGPGPFTYLLLELPPRIFAICFSVSR